MYPNTVTYNPKLTVNDYITQAGGYGYRSKKSKAYIIYLNGNVERARRFSKNVVEPGCEIVVPQKRAKDGQLQEILSISTTAASLATMVATIGNIIR
jgi:protein involved in polysaccharide export with SLBB domain